MVRGSDVGVRDRALFDEIAEQYCKKDQHRAARIARRHRLERTLVAAGAPADARVLEVGCGAGFAASYLRGRYRRYVGVDHSIELIALARELNSGEGVSFCVSDAADFVADEPFDVVLMIGVLHHFDQIPRMLGRLVELVVPGGLVIANEPHPSNPLIRAARSVRKRIDAHYSSDQRELSEEELRTELTDAGLVDVRIIPQGLLSTPLAEVPLGPTRITAPLARWACALDGWAEDRFGGALARLSWNLIAVGRRPS